MEHLPADQVTSPQKAHELAVRFENHVAFSTSTKVKYITIEKGSMFILCCQLGTISGNDCRKTSDY